MVLLVIDTQDLILTDNLYAKDQFIFNLKKIISCARQFGHEIVYIRHDDGTELTKGKEGFEIYREFVPSSKEKIFDKNYNSAFKNTGLTEYLKSKQENTLIVTGLQTDYCIDATIKGGFELGFEIYVPAYCNTTVDNEYMTGKTSYKYHNEKMWHGRFAKCITFEEALEMLQ